MSSPALQPFGVPRAAATGAPEPPALHHLADHQRSFAASLGRAGAGAPPQSAPDRARDAAEQFITQTLILPLLKHLRATSQAAPPFAPTGAEKQFGALRDAELAQRIAHATRFPLVDRLARDLLDKAIKGKDPEAALREARAALPTSQTSPGTPRLIPGTAKRAR